MHICAYSWYTLRIWDFHPQHCILPGQSAGPPSSQERRQKVCSLAKGNPPSCTSNLPSRKVKQDETAARMNSDRKDPCKHRPSHIASTFPMRGQNFMSAVALSRPGNLYQRLKNLIGTKVAVKAELVSAWCLQVITCVFGIHFSSHCARSCARYRLEMKYAFTQKNFDKRRAEDYTQLLSTGAVFLKHGSIDKLLAHSIRDQRTSKGWSNSRRTNVPKQAG